MIEHLGYRNRRRAVLQIGFVSSDGVICPTISDQTDTNLPCASVRRRQINYRKSFLASRVAETIVERN